MIESGKITIPFEAKPSGASYTKEGLDYFVETFKYYQKSNKCELLL